MPATPLPRVQRILFPWLRPLFPDVTFTSWGADVDFRTFPTVNIRRLGGIPKHPRLLGRTVIEMTAYGNVDMPTTEELWDSVSLAIWEMTQNSGDVAALGNGHISSYRVTMGATQFDSPFDDTWRIQGLIQLGIRPPA